MFCPLTSHVRDDIPHRTQKQVSVEKVIIWGLGRGRVFFPPSVKLKEVPGERKAAAAARIKRHLFEPNLIFYFQQPKKPSLHYRPSDIQQRTTHTHKPNNKQNCTERRMFFSPSKVKCCEPYNSNFNLPLKYSCGYPSHCSGSKGTPKVTVAQLFLMAIHFKGIGLQIYLQVLRIDWKNVWGIKAQLTSQIKHDMSFWQ